MTDINQQPFLLGKVYTDTKQLMSILHVTNELKGLENLDTGIMLADMNDADNFFADPAGVFESGDISQETYDEFNEAFEDSDAEAVFDAVKAGFGDLEDLDAQLKTGKEDDDKLLNKADIQAQEKILQQAKDSTDNPKTAIKFISPQDDITAIMKAIVTQNPDTKDKNAITREQLNAFKSFVKDLDRNFEEAANGDDTLTMDELKSAYTLQDLASDVKLKDPSAEGGSDSGSDSGNDSGSQTGHCQHGHRGHTGGWMDSWQGMWPGQHRGHGHHGDNRTTAENTEPTDTSRSDSSGQSDTQYTVKAGDTLSQIVLDYQKKHGNAEKYTKANGSFDWNLLKADYMKVVEANPEIKAAAPDGHLIRPGWKINLSVLKT